MSHYDFRKSIALAWIKSDEPSIRERQKQKEERKKSFEEQSTISSKRTATSDQSSNATISNKRRKKDDNKRETRSAAVEEVNKKPRAPTMNDSALNDRSGPFVQRLNRMVGHYCTTIERGARCALHRWCSGIEVKKNVFSCSVCKVHLCIECFQIFHTAYDLVDEKEALGDKFKQEKANADRSEPAAASKKK
jgi:hypothetical protein